MRLDCEVLTVRENSHQSCKLQHSKSCRGIVTLGKQHMKGEHRYLLQVSTRRAVKGTPIEVTPDNVKEVHLQRALSGRATFVFKNPAVAVMIVKSNPAHLHRFIQNFNTIAKGGEVALKSLETVKESDFKPQPKCLRVTMDNIRGILYPSSLEVLEVTGLNLASVDTRWFSLPNLKHLDLSRNRLGQAENFVKMRLISRLTKLQLLNLEANEIQHFPPFFFESFPSSLQTLNLATNSITLIPRSLMRIRSIRTLILSRNSLKDIPRDICEMRLHSLFIDDNSVDVLPYELKAARLERFYCSGNDLSLPRICEKDFLRIGVTLCSLALTAVRRHSISETLLPWDLTLISDLLCKKCSVCREWNAASFMSSFFVTRHVDFVFETDMRDRVTMKCLACRRCYLPWIDRERPDDE